MLAPTLALADAWYGDFGLAFNFARDLKLGDDKVKFDLKIPAASLAVGRLVGDRWRFELEWTHRDNDLEVIYNPATGSEIRPDNGDGIVVDGFQLNAEREFRLGAWRPYLGAGLGPAHVRIRMGEANNGGAIILPRQPILDDETWAVGLQAMAGFSIPLSPRLDLAFDYRFWHTPSIEVTAANGEAFDLKHTIHSGTMHVRYLFSDARTLTPTTLRTPDTGWYLTGSLGGGFAVDADIQNSLENLDAFRVGPVWSGAVGYGLSPRWRVEIEAARRTNAVEIVDFAPVNGQFRAMGDVRATSLMANVVYRFRPDRPIRPFIGVGAGGAKLRYRVDTRGEVYLHDDDTAPALQLIMGLDVALTPRLDFTGDLRTWYTDWVELTRPDGETARLPHWVTSLSVGLRFSI